MVLTIENLKVKVNELLNEKEDMIAIHQSDSSVKEHLNRQINEHEMLNMEKTTELLFLKKKLQELLSEKIEVDEVRDQAQKEMQEVK